jgi:hypothetical protein
VESWFIPLLSLVVGVIGGVIGAHIGVKVAIGKLEVRVSTIEIEVAKLRDEKHRHANVLTQHELRIENIERDLRK